MKNVISRYVNQFDWTKIMDDLVSKVISLAILFVLFYIAKKTAPQFSETHFKTVFELCRSG